MFELIIAAIAILISLIIIFWIRKYRVRKKTPKKATSIQSTAFPESAKQVEENKPNNKSQVDTEFNKVPPQVKELLSPAEPKSTFVAESHPNELASVSQKHEHENLPQDFMLRRHYLSNLRAMIESLNCPRPTEFSLSRHYDAMIMAETEQCLSDQDAMARLISNYESHKKIVAQQTQALKTIAEPSLNAEISHEDTAAQHGSAKLPEDSMLRRHAITQLKAMVESNAPLRPTDSVLRRHYDTMIKTEVNKLLDCNVL